MWERRGPARPQRPNPIGANLRRSSAFSPGTTSQHAYFHLGTSGICSQFFRAFCSTQTSSCVSPLKAICTFLNHGRRICRRSRALQMRDLVNYRSTPAPAREERGSDVGVPPKISLTGHSPHILLHTHNTQPRTQQLYHHNPHHYTRYHINHHLGASFAVSYYRQRGNIQIGQHPTPRAGISQGTRLASLFIATTCSHAYL